MRRRLLLLSLVAGAFGALYSRRRELIARALRLPPAKYGFRIERKIPIPMPDGTILYADRYYPAAEGSFPTVLIRTPYGRRNEAGPLSFMSDLGGSLYAERGFQVLVQGVRGRFASQGEFDPLTNEEADGKATLAWVAQQPWFNGRLGLWGSSYLGYTQWCVAADAPPFVNALMPVITSTRFSRLVYPQDGVFALETAVRWAQLISRSDGKPRLGWRDMTIVSTNPEAEAALNTNPISVADIVAAGKPIAFFQDWLANPNASDEYWRERDHFDRLSKIDAPAHLIAGWYDIFLREQLADYAALLAAGRTPYLTVGGQHHGEVTVMLDSIREGLEWFDALLNQRLDQLKRRPVRIYLMGADEWHEMDFWPPMAKIVRWYLRGDQTLAAEPLAEDALSRYVYNPADPTPNVGGPLLINPLAGRQDQREVEFRNDVLVFTSPILEHDVDVIGPVHLELYVRSSREHTDFIGRMCEVLPDGSSFNICDGIFRVTPGAGEPLADGSRLITIDMWATAQRFRKGHRIRLHVTSAAHPRWAANLGTGDFTGIPEAANVAEQTIFHDAAHPSALVLPVVTEEERRGELD